MKIVLNIFATLSFGCSVITTIGPMPAAFSSTFITVNCRRRADTTVFSPFNTTQMFTCKWSKWVHNGKQNIKSRKKYKLQNKRLKTEDMTMCNSSKMGKKKKKRMAAATAAVAACMYKKGRRSDKWMHYEYRAHHTNNNRTGLCMQTKQRWSEMKWSEAQLKRW